MKRLLATYSNSVMTLVMLAVFLVLVGIAFSVRLGVVLNM